MAYNRRAAPRAPTIKPELEEILKRYDIDPQADCWDCHGTLVVYHRALERVAAKQDIVFDVPSVLIAERDAAVLLVTGTTSDSRREWSIGEADMSNNYKVGGKQAAYPFAMAEKRAKDRVILKLIGLSGDVYSEEEADEFKESRPRFQPERADNGGVVEESPAVPRESSQIEKLEEIIQVAMIAAKSEEELENVWREFAGELQAISKAEPELHKKLVARFKAQRVTITKLRRPEDQNAAA